MSAGWTRWWSNASLGSFCDRAAIRCVRVTKYLAEPPGSKTIRIAEAVRDWSDEDISAALNRMIDRVCQCCLGDGWHDEDEPYCSECEGSGRVDLT